MSLNFERQKFRIGFNIDPPYIFKTNSQFLGIEVSIIGTMAEYFNFTTEMIDCQGSYGIDNGTIGKLSRNEIDFAIGGHFMIFERSALVQEIYPHTIDFLTFATTIPKNRVSFNTFLKPFSNLVWLCLLMCFGMFFLYNQFKLYVLLRTIPIKRKYLKHQTYSRNYNLNLVWLSLAILFRQPYHSLRIMNLSIKIFAFTWSLASLILITAYGGNLYSIIAVPTLSTIDTIWQLANSCSSKQISVLVQPNTTTTEVFSKSRLKTFKHIWECCLDINSTREGIEKIISQRFLPENDQKQYAVLSSYIPLKNYELTYGPGSLYLPAHQGSDSSFYNTFIHIPARVSFEHEHEFSKLVQRIQATGLVEHWFETQFLKAKFVKKFIDQKEIPKEDEDERGDDYDDTIQLHKDSYNNFSLLQYKSTIFLYLISTSIAILIFIVEIFPKKW